MVMEQTRPYSNLIILIASYLFISSIGFYHTSNALEEDKKLKMSLYYESQCPDCDGFIMNDLFPVWNKIHGDDYINLELVPYGNAITQKTPEGQITIQCQHGPTECLGNILHNCALKHLPTQDLQLTFITCTFFSRTPYKAGPSCAKLLKLDFSPIYNCTKGPEGANLHYLAGNVTNSLSPSHTYVPWIIFNDIYNKTELDDAQANFLGFICKKLKSMGVSRLPEQCQEQRRADSLNESVDDNGEQNSIDTV